MREWTKEEKYRYLKDPQELKELYDRISTLSTARLSTTRR